jgi:ubiquinone/menaquinone biosynthesis C-methylase UbiE
MDVKESYNNWARQYDTNLNKTRDLEALSLRETLAELHFDSCLEIGCGTGKNTAWLLGMANEILAIDLSEEMLLKAKLKINSPKVVFQSADINTKWTFGTNKFDLTVFSLVLEHIENLDQIFEKLNESTQKNGYVYIGELHPFKQYSGTKARFETESGTQVVPCFTHNISDFTQVAARYGFAILKVNEYFDDNNKASIPRILTLLFQKQYSL